MGSFSTDMQEDQCLLPHPQFFLENISQNAPRTHEESRLSLSLTAFVQSAITQLT
jgi:hypothetical protein